MLNHKEKKKSMPLIVHLISWAIYFSVFITTSLICTQLFGSTAQCFQTFDRIGSWFGLLIIVPIYIFVNWLYKLFFN